VIVDVIHKFICFDRIVFACLLQFFVELPLKNVWDGTKGVFLGNGNPFGYASAECRHGQVLIGNSACRCVDEGTFGRVYRGTVVIGAGECTSIQNVVIKTVTGQFGQQFVVSPYWAQRCVPRSTVPHSCVSLPASFPLRIYSIKSLLLLLL